MGKIRRWLSSGGPRKKRYVSGANLRREFALGMKTRGMGIKRYQRGFARIGGYYGRFGAELKFFDTNTSTQPVSNAGIIHSPTLLVIPQDNTQSGRIGRKVNVKSISGHLKCSMDSSTTTGTRLSDTLRIIIYLDKQCNGAAATVLQILNTAAVNSFRNLEQSERFRVLWEKEYSLNYGGGQGNGSTISWSEVVRKYKVNIKCHIPVVYDNALSTGALTTIRSNNIGVLAISTNGVADLVATWRIRYSDKSA